MSDVPMKSPAEIIGRQIAMTLLKVVVGRLITDAELDAARSEAVGAIKALAEAGYRIVPVLPTEAQWSGLARDLVMWDRMTRPTGQALYQHLDRIGRDVPDWLRQEIPATDHVPPKGTVAACIYRSMLDAAPDAGGGNG